LALGVGNYVTFDTSAVPKADRIEIALQPMIEATWRMLISPRPLAPLGFGLPLAASTVL
jgi:hypothetical protein